MSPEMGCVGELGFQEAEMREVQNNGKQNNTVGKTLFLKLDS